MAEITSADSVRPRAWTGIFVVTAGAHAVLLFALISTLGLRQRQSEPTVMDVEVIRRFHPAAPPKRTSRSATPQRGPTRLTARGAAAPQITPPPPILSVPPGEPRVGITPGVREALRKQLGCSDADVLHLTRAERARCDEELAAGARQPVPTPLGIDPATQAAFAAGYWRNRQPPLAQTPHDGCDPNVSEKEFAHGNLGREDWHVGVGCAVSLDKVGRALGLGR